MPNNKKNWPDAKKGPPKTPRPAFNGAVYRQPDKIMDAATGRTLLIDAILKKDDKRIERLLASGANPGKVDKDGKSPLHYAARLGQLDTMKMLVQKGAQINPRDRFLATPLFEAIESPFPLEVIDYLLKEGGSADIADVNNRIPLHVAAQKSNKEIIRYLMQATENPDRPDKKGITPLHEACRSNSVEAVKELFSKPVSVFNASEEGDTPLHFAAQRTEDDVAKYLLTMQAAQLANAVNMNGQTPLHLAIETDKVELVRQLLDIGADVNLPDRQGWTPLHQAIKRNNEKLVRLLVESGADISKSTTGAATTPLLLALSTDQIPVVRILLDHNADPNFIDRTDTFPLQMAVFRANHEAINLLLEAGANINQVNRRGYTALHIASVYGREDEVRFLLSKKADPNVADSDGRTPLYMCVNTDSMNIGLPCALLDAGANPLAKDHRGVSPFDRAYDLGKKVLVDIFRKKLAEKGIYYTPNRPPPPRWNSDYY